MKFEIRLHQTNKETVVLYATDNREEAISYYKNEYVNTWNTGVDVFTRVSLYRGAIEIAVFEFDNHLGTTKVVRHHADGAYLPNDPLASIKLTSKNVLRELRKERALTQQELADITGVSKRTIEQYERADADLSKASGEVLYRLSQALNVQIEDLLTFNYKFKWIEGYNLGNEQRPYTYWLENQFGGKIYLSNERIESWLNFNHYNLDDFKLFKNRHLVNELIEDLKIKA